MNTKQYFSVPHVVNACELSVDQTVITATGPVSAKAGDFVIIKDHVEPGQFVRQGGKDVPLTVQVHTVVPRAEFLALYDTQLDTTKPYVPPADAHVELSLVEKKAKLVSFGVPEVEVAPMTEAEANDALVKHDAFIKSQSKPAEPAAETKPAAAKK